MQDKSSYTSHHKPQISEGLQNFINAMVEEIVLKGEAFDEQKKKWLKKYSEAEGLKYAELEGNLNDFFELIEDYKRIKSNGFRCMIIPKLANQASTCFLNNALLDKILSQQPQIILPIIVPDTQIKTVKIGNQIWMAEDIFVSNYQNGERIKEITQNEIENAELFNQPAMIKTVSNRNRRTQVRYNWYAINDKREIAPSGFRVSTDNDWRELIQYIGGSHIAGGALKQKSYENWNSPNKTTETISYLFNALPIIPMNEDEEYGYEGIWWTSTEDNINNDYAWSIRMCYSNEFIVRHSLWKEGFYPVRCIKI